MLMWSLQSSMYVMGWQFGLNGQLNWTAAEANWRLLVEPIAATNYAIIEAACLLASSASIVAGDWDLGMMMCTQAYHGLMCE